MTERYLNPAGSAASPYTSRATAANAWWQIAAVLQDNDIVYVSGEVFTAIVLNAKTGLVVQQDPGQVPARVDGSTTDNHTLVTTGGINCRIIGIEFANSYTGRSCAYLRGTGTIIDKCRFVNPAADRQTIYAQESVGETLIRCEIAAKDRQAIYSINNNTIDIIGNDIYNFDAAAEIAYPLITTSGTGTFKILANYLRGEGSAAIYCLNNATTVEVINNIMGPMGINGSAFNNYVVQAAGSLPAITNKNNIPIPNIFQSTGLGNIFSTNVPDDGGNIVDSPAFKSNPFSGYFIFGADDGNYEYVLDLAALAEEFGAQITWYVNRKTFYLAPNNTDVDSPENHAAKIATMQYLAGRGHDIASHAWSHSDLADLRAMTVRYTGTGSAALTVSGNSLVIDASDNQYDINIPFVSTDGLSNLETYTSLGDIADTLEAAGDGNGYVVSIQDRQWRYNQATSLADVAGQDLSVDYTALFDFDRYKIDEVDDSVAWLESVIRQPVVSFGAPYNSYSAAMQAHLKTKFTSTRGGGDAVLSTPFQSFNLRLIDLGNIGMRSIVDWFTNDVTYTESQKRIMARQIGERLANTGAVVSTFCHNDTEFSIASWRQILEEFRNFSITFLSQAEFAEIVMDPESGWVKDSGTQYVKSMPYASLLHTSAASVAVSAGADVPELYGQPDKHGDYAYGKYNIGPSQRAGAPSGGQKWLPNASAIWAV